MTPATSARVRGWSAAARIRVEASASAWVRVGSVLSRRWQSGSAAASDARVSQWRVSAGIVRSRAGDGSSGTERGAGVRPRRSAAARTPGDATPWTGLRLSVGRARETAGSSLRESAGRRLRKAGAAPVVYLVSPPFSRG
ncbi:hypothetical protein GCM10010299_45340 [Streptomyces tanashiensis]|nr:hypothetical protein GCM10010299_45340 [Streptomyces tanashiensis]